MCGRFTLTVHQLGDVVEQVGAFVAPEHLAEHRPRYNVAPGDMHWILRHARGRRELLRGSWGLINQGARDASLAFKQINARAETLSVRPAYRAAYRSRRCLLPADGFYEWRGPRGAREPLWFHRPDHGVMWLAGLYEGWTDPASGEARKTFTIITTDANDTVRPIHDRMPVIVPLERIDGWLLGEPAPELLVPAPADLLQLRPVSLRVNSAADDDPDLLDPDDPQAKRQLSLF